MVRISDFLCVFKEDRLSSYETLTSYVVINIILGFKVLPLAVDPLLLLIFFEASGIVESWDADWFQFFTGDKIAGFIDNRKLSLGPPSCMRIMNMLFTLSHYLVRLQTISELMHVKEASKFMILNIVQKHKRVESRN